MAETAQHIYSNILIYPLRYAFHHEKQGMARSCSIIDALMGRSFTLRPALEFSTKKAHDLSLHRKPSKNSGCFIIFEPTSCCLLHQDQAPKGTNTKRKSVFNIYIYIYILSI